MKKDLFIDNNIASKFTNPQDEEYKNLTRWLLNYNDKENKDDYAHLVVSQKLLVEYLRSAVGASSSTCIPVIIDRLTREGRLIKIDNQQLKDFKKRFFTKAVQKRLLCNNEDRDHIPVVLLSDRKFALTLDERLAEDLRNFNGFNVRVEKRPEDLPYKD